MSFGTVQASILSFDTIFDVYIELDFTHDGQCYASVQLAPIVTQNKAYFSFNYVLHKIFVFKKQQMDTPATDRGLDNVDSTAFPDFYVTTLINSSKKRENLRVY